MMEGIRRCWQLTRAALKKEREQPAVKRKGQELEFLPAALEIQETPPSALARLLAFLICLIFILFIVISCFAFIDTEATAEGKLVPVGEIKTIQSQIIGRVEKLYVSEDDQVKKGQMLIKLDPTEQQVDINQIRVNLQDALLNISRLTRLFDAIDRQQEQLPQMPESIDLSAYGFEWQESGNQRMIQQQRLENEFILFKRTDEALVSTIEQNQATIRAIKAEIHRLKELEPLHVQHEQNIKTLYNKGHLSRLEWLAAKEKQVDTSQQLLVQTNRLAEAQAALAITVKERKRQQQSFRKDWADALADYRMKKESSELALLKARELDQRTSIRSPVDGVVYQLKVHTEGAVLQPAEYLMLLIPDDAEMEVEAMLPNKDIGFVKEGMRADIKLEAFPFTYYGYLTGTVRQVSVSAVEREGMEPSYPIRIRLDQQTIYADNLWRNLQAGMTATVEVKTGYRRLLAFFMSPLMRYQDETLRVR